MRAGNPATNPELLDYLTSEFIKSGFNPRHVLKLICESRTYQLSVETNKWNADDKVNYSHAVARRLPAEVLLDAVYRVTGSISKFPGVAPGIRAAALPDSGVELPSGFLTTFGRPCSRESACECERTSGMQLGPVMALVSGPTLGDAIADPANELTRLVTKERDDAKLIDELFIRIMNRHAKPEEIASCQAEMQAIEGDHTRLAQALGQRETEFALKRPKLERDRETAIETAKTALACLRERNRSKRRSSGAEEERSDREAAKASDPSSMKPSLAQLSRRVGKGREVAESSAGSRSELTMLSSVDTNGAAFAKEGEGVVFASRGKDEPGVITFTAETNLTGVTGIRLELLNDARLPRGGPGRAAGDGNFVLNEIQLTDRHSQGRPGRRQRPWTLQRARQTSVRGELRRCPG